MEKLESIQKNDTNSSQMEFIGQQKKLGEQTQTFIHTMKSDAEEVIRKQNETSVSIAIAEEKKRVQEQEKETLAKQGQSEIVAIAPKRIARVVVLVALILIITAIALAYTFMSQNLKNITLPAIPTFSFGKSADMTNQLPIEKKTQALTPSILPAQSEKHFTINKETLSYFLSEVSIDRQQIIPIGSIRNLYFTEENTSGNNAISSNRFFDFMNVKIPEILSRSLEKPFMVGFLGENGGVSTAFIILKVSEYGTALAGVLEWETELARNFNTIFSGNTEIANATKFHDIVISGKDARIFDTFPKETTAYAFVNTNTLIIAGSYTALESLLTLALKN